MYNIIFGIIGIITFLIGIYLLINDNIEGDNNSVYIAALLMWVGLSLLLCSFYIV